MTARGGDGRSGEDDTMGRGALLERQFLAACQVQLPGAEHGNGLHPLDRLGDPQVRCAPGAKLFAQFSRVEIARREEDKRFALRFVRDAGDGDDAFILWEGEQFDDAMLDGFVWDHFPADFREAAEAALDEEKAVLVEARE